ncbi:MAG: hypothetical protein KDC38_14145, partial [Planctomycetes bacterium]|nr:hypothetical protein [Planctomycetota bacterium]
QLAGGARFNVISFNNEIASFTKSLVPASGQNKGRAAKWVDRLRADNATHTDEALERAFADPDVDTLILLSDGAPMKATDRDHVALAARILERVEELNRLRKIRIFTFGFEGEGEWPPGSKYRRGAPASDSRAMVDFLRTLAEKNGGTYTAID